MANKARRTLEDVLDVRARDRRPKLPMARLDNPVAHPSGAEGGAACAVRGVLVRVLQSELLKST